MDHRIIEILGLRPSNRLPVSYYYIEELFSDVVMVLDRDVFVVLYPCLKRRESLYKRNTLSLHI